MLKSSIKDWGLKPFRSLNVWYMVVSFKEFVKDKWDSYNMHGNGV